MLTERQGHSLKGNIPTKTVVSQIYIIFQFCGMDFIFYSAKLKAINSFHASEKFHIYITGSNAFLLSKELATLFTGRTFSVEVFPFSFKEFVSYYECHDLQQAFDRFAMEGGMEAKQMTFPAQKQWKEKLHHFLA